MRGSVDPRPLRHIPGFSVGDLSEPVDHANERERHVGNIRCHWSVFVHAAICPEDSLRQGRGRS